MSNITLSPDREGWFKANAGTWNFNTGLTLSLNPSVTVYYRYFTDSSWYWHSGGYWAAVPGLSMSYRFGNYTFESPITYGSSYGMLSGSHTITDEGHTKTITGYYEGEIPLTLTDITDVYNAMAALVPSSAELQAFYALASTALAASLYVYYDSSSLLKINTDGSVGTNCYVADRPSKADNYGDNERCKYSTAEVLNFMRIKINAALAECKALADLAGVTTVSSVRDLT